MAKIQLTTLRGPRPAPRLAEKAYQDVVAPIHSPHSQHHGLDELAWMLDGNSGAIPAEVLARLNGTVTPRH